MSLSDAEAWRIRFARQDQERALDLQLRVLRERLLDVPEYRELATKLAVLKATPLDCGCHCSGWCNGWNPCAQACPTHMCR